MKEFFLFGGFVPLFVTVSGVNPLWNLLLAISFFATWAILEKQTKY